MNKFYKVSAGLLALVTALTSQSVFATNENKQFSIDNENEIIETSKPNIINIIVDDWGFMDSAIYRNYTLNKENGGFYETPNFDALAKQGVMFTNAYSGSNLCSPSRAAMLTGRYGPRNGVTRLCNQQGIAPNELESVTNWDGEKWLNEAEPGYLPDDEITIAEQLKTAGYTTAHIGKWHLGDPTKGAGPCDQGFDINIGGYKAGQPKSYFSPYNNPYLEDGPKGEYLTDRLTEEAVNFIDNHKDEPFFLNLSHYAVHTPHQAKQEYIDYFKGKNPDGNRKNPTYAAVIKSMDDSLGKVMNALKNSGLSKNTIVTVTSDNGGLHYWDVTDNSPLRKGKCFNYEGGIRVPTLVVWDGHIKGGQINDTPINNIDLFPTYCDVAGIELPKDRRIDGVSLLDMLIENKPLEERSLFWYTPHINLEVRDMAPASAAMRHGNYKLVWNITPADTRISQVDTAEFELYDLSKDIGEKYNLIDEYPEKAEKMKKELKRWLYEGDAVLPIHVIKDKPVLDFPSLDLSDMDIKAMSSILDHEVNLAIDNDKKTYWQGEKLDVPQSVVIDMKKEFNIDALTYQPADKKNMGNIVLYEIYTSNDAKNYTLQTKGKWDNNNMKKIAYFDAVNARYVKFRIINATGKMPAIAELGICEHIEIDSIKAVNAYTLKGIDPVLPKTVDVVYSNNDIVTYPVEWDMKDVNLNEIGEHKIYGTVTGVDQKAQCTLYVEKAKQETDLKKEIFGDFNGKSDVYKELGSKSKILNSESFTLEMDVSIDGLNGNWQTLIEQFNDDMNLFRLDVSPDGNVCLHVDAEVMKPQDDTHPWVSLRSKESLEINKLTNIKVIFSSKYNKVYLYFDNELQAEGVIDKALNNIENLSVGSKKSEYRLNGEVKDLTVYNGVLLPKSTLISKKGITAIDASSESTVTESGNKENLLDDNPDTYWNIDYNDENNLKMPHSVTFDLGKLYTLNKVSFLPRQSGKNGDIITAAIEVSVDGKNYVKVGEYNFEYSGNRLLNRTEFKDMKFNPVKVRYVKFVALHTLGDYGVDMYANAAEVNFYGEIFTDKILLKDALEKANMITEEDLKNIPPSVVEEFKSIRKEANKIYGDTNATQEIIDSVYNDLINIMQKLECYKTDKTALKIALDLANAITDEDLANVVPVVVNEFKAVRDQANEVYNNASATQEQVNNAFDRLSSIMQKLEFFKGDKTALKAFIDKVSGLEAAKYTEATWTPFNDALTAATSVYNDENAMQEEVNNAYNELVTAFLKLRLIPDKSLLEDLINQANGLNSANYTKATFDGLTKALNEAKAVFNNPNATQVEVDNAKAELEKAMANLQTVKTPVNNGDTTVSVKTGDDALVGTLAGLVLLSMVGVRVFRKKE